MDYSRNGLHTFNNSEIYVHVPLNLSWTGQGMRRDQLFYFFLIRTRSVLYVCLKEPSATGYINNYKGGR